MKAASVKFLHNEHIEWLSDARHWEKELDFLDSILNKINGREKSDSQEKAIGEIENDIRHHRTLLKNLVSDIHSHESFIKDILNDNEISVIEEEDLTDHNKHREHIRNFKKTVRKLKIEVFRLSEEIL